ncbi:unnamed protein product [Rotaria sp. Silwood1]|nr:unnamed protein product [Rotaria sp. Silwood1]
MCENQALLTYSNKSDDDDNNKNQYKSSMFSKFICFFRRHKKASEDENDALDNSNHESIIKFIQLFNFSDRIDMLLLFIGLLSTILHAICIVIHNVLFGRLTGDFITTPFSNGCQSLMKNLSLLNQTNFICPFGIELNESNYHRYHKCCTDKNMLLKSTMSTFRSDTNNKILCLWIIGCIELVLGTVQYYTFTISAKRQTSRINILLFQSLIGRDINYFDTNPAGVLNRKLFDNINMINKGIGFELSALIGTIICSIISIIVCFFFSWKLTLIMISTIPFVFVGLQIFSKLTNKETKNELASYAKAGQIVQEVFSSIRTVLSLNGGKFELERYQKAVLDTTKSNIRKGSVLGLFIGWLIFISYLINSIGFIFSSILLHDDNQLNISDILVVINVFAQGVSVFGYIGPFIQSALEARIAATPIFQLIDQTEKRNKNNKENANINGHIQFKNVYFNYPCRKDITVLNNLNLTIQYGKTTALVGESGSGKSTCISLLLKYYDHSSGEILINDHSISEYDTEQLRLNIGVVLFSTTIYENISYGKENATKDQIEEAAKQANAHDFIMKLPNKYSTLVGEGGIQLSVGEKQRIALARALVKQSQILLLDEATSALDCENEYIIQQALNNICKG